MQKSWHKGFFIVRKECLLQLFCTFQYIYRAGIMHQDEVKSNLIGYSRHVPHHVRYKVTGKLIHILPVVSQILRLSKPFISCYFVMSSEGLWACCLLLIGYKDGSLLRENLNFLMVNARGYFGLGDLLHLVSISNELYNSGLLPSTYLKNNMPESTLQHRKGIFPDNKPNSKALQL